MRYIKAKHWDRQKLDACTVIIKTDDRPITQGRNLIILMILDNSFAGINWKAFDAEGKLLSSDTEEFAGAKPFPPPPLEDKPRELIDLENKIDMITNSKKWVKGE